MNAATPSTTPNTNNSATMPSTHGSFDFFFGPAVAIGWACAAAGNCGDKVDGNGAEVAIGPEPDCGAGCVGCDVCCGDGSEASVPESATDVSVGGGGGSTGVRS